MANVPARVVAVLLVLAFVLVPHTVSAQAQTAPLPFTVYQGTFTNADYQIVVPNPISNWNGTLLVFAHGYEFELQPAVAAPSQDLAYALAASGYAVAGSAFRDGGWAVKEGLQNTVALTNRFNGLIGKPKRTILWGFSLGSIVTLKGIEQYPGIYDGAIAGCSVGGGAPVGVDLALDLSLAYSVTFGWPPAWGTVANVRDTLQFDPEVKAVIVPQILAAASGDTQALAKFEFIRRVLALPANDFYPNPADPVNKPGGFLVDMAFATQARAELEQRAHGAVSQDLDHVYSLSAVDQGTLVALGGDPAKWLADMNSARTYAADPQARNYVKHYSEFTGDLKRPVLTIHTTVDPINPPFHERLYAETVQAAGKSAYLLQLFTDGVGHCEFTGAQLVATIVGMEMRLDSGSWPPPEFFTALATGFDFAYQPPQPYYRPVAAAQQASVAPAADSSRAWLYLPLASK